MAKRYPVPSMTAFEKFSSQQHRHHGGQQQRNRYTLQNIAALDNNDGDQQHRNINLRRRVEQVDYWKQRAGWFDDDYSMKEYNNGVYDTYYTGNGGSSSGSSSSGSSSSSSGSDSSSSSSSGNDEPQTTNGDSHRPHWRRHGRSKRHHIRHCRGTSNGGRRVAAWMGTATTWTIHRLVQNRTKTKSSTRIENARCHPMRLSSSLSSGCAATPQ
mmetsp:Transcript_44421/g.107454  ORF Transcript_44421/g.107454 Transcript_44421/m.107454 type:complete len:213 (-) Transcript_44421:2373-3011(-)